MRARPEQGLELCDQADWHVFVHGALAVAGEAHDGEARHLHDRGRAHLPRGAQPGQVRVPRQRHRRLLHGRVMDENGSGGGVVEVEIY